MSRRLRVSLVAIAVILVLVGLGAARVPSLTVETVQRMIDKTIADRVPGMIDTAIDGITVETTIIEQTAGVTIEDVNAAIDAKVPGMLESVLDERLGGEDLNPAIPLPVITNPVAGAYNVRDYGTVGDGVTDDRAAINAAITAANAAGGGTVYVPDGTYRVVAPAAYQAAITLRSNVELLLSANATIQLAPNSYAGCYVIRLGQIDNVKIRGGKIYGDRLAHTGFTGEWGMGIAVYGATNVYIADTVLSYCWGDGLYLAGASSTGYCSNVVVERVLCTYSRRLGMAIISGSNITVSDSEFSFNGLGTDGTRPKAGYDLEPNATTEILKDITLLNLRTSNNGEYGVEVWFGCGTANNMALPTANVSNVRIINNQSVGNGISNAIHNGTFYVSKYDITIS